MNQLGSSSADQDRDQQQQQQLQVAGDHDQQQQGTGPIENRRRAAAAAIAIIGGGGGQQQQQQNQNQNQPIHHQHHHPQPPPQPCPRCNSANTKFCYYNNYSLAQPRYFCKACRRYWTQGGTLRNVPVGGGGRKTKRTRVDDPVGTYQRRREQQPPVVVTQPPPLVPPRALPRAAAAAVEQAAVVNRTSNVALMAAGGAIASVAAAENQRRGLNPTAAAFNYPGNNSGSTGFLSSFAAANQAMMINQPPISSQGYSHLFMSMAAAGAATRSSNSGLLQSLLGTQIHPNLYPLPTSSGTSSTGPNLIRATLPTTSHPPTTTSLSMSTTPQLATTTEWQSFRGNVSPPGSDPRFWSIGRSAGGEGSGAAAGVGTSKDVGSSSSPNRWPEFPGCGPDDDDDSS